MSAAADRIVEETRMVCNRRAGTKPRYRKPQTHPGGVVSAPRAQNPSGTRAQGSDGKTQKKRDQNRGNRPYVRRSRATTEVKTEEEDQMMFEFIAEPGIIVANAQATTTTERLKLISVALGN